MPSHLTSEIVYPPWRKTVDHFAFSQEAGIYPLFFVIEDDDDPIYRRLPPSGTIDYAYMLTMYPDLAEAEFDKYYEARLRMYEHRAEYPLKFGPYASRRERSQQFRTMRDDLSL